MGNTYLIGFSRRYNPLSWLIRLFTDSNVTHCYIVKVATNDEEHVLEAADGGVKERTRYEWFARGHTVVSEFTVIGATDAEWEEMKGKTLGLPYGWWQLPGDAWALLVEAITGKRPANPIDHRGYVCSELCLKWLLMCGQKGGGLKQMDPGNVTASDLYEWAGRRLLRTAL